MRRLFKGSLFFIFMGFIAFIEATLPEEESAQEMKSTIPLVRTRSQTNADFIERVWREFGEERRGDLDEIDGNKIFLAYAWEEEDPKRDYCVKLARDLRRFGLTTVTAIEKNQHESIDAFFERYVSHQALVETSNYVMLMFSKKLLQKYTEEVTPGTPEPIIKGEVDAVIQLLRYPELQSKILLSIIDGEEKESIPSKLMSYPRIDFRDGTHEKSTRGSETYVIGLRQVLEKILINIREVSYSQGASLEESLELPEKRAKRGLDERGIAWEKVTDKDRIITNLDPLDIYIETVNQGTGLSYLAELGLWFNNQEKHLFTIKGEKNVGRKSLARAYAQESYEKGAYEVIWFVKGREVEKSYEELLGRLSPGSGEKELSESNKELKGLLAQKKTLMIFEKLDRTTYERIKPSLINGMNMHMLFISRDTLSGVAYFDLPPFQEDEAKEYFTRLHGGSSQFQQGSLLKYMNAAKRLRFYPGALKDLDISRKQDLVEQLIKTTSWRGTNALIEEIEDQKELLEEADVQRLIEAKEENIELEGAFRTPEFFNYLKRRFPDLFVN